MKEISLYYIHKVCIAKSLLSFFYRYDISDKSKWCLTLIQYYNIQEYGEYIFHS